MEDCPINFSPHEDIAACTNALNALGEYDFGMMDDEENDSVLYARCCNFRESSSKAKNSRFN